MKRILVVEDVSEMRELLVELLRGIPGLEAPSSAANGMEARLEMGRRKPDLVFLDEVLPGESSLDLLKELRAQGIPVILLTGMSRGERPIPEGAKARWKKPSWKSLEQDRQRFSGGIKRL
jgi:CheY-like chemotaxis protein